LNVQYGDLDPREVKVNSFEEFFVTCANALMDIEVPLL
jgi:hypothetical protein